MNDLLNLIFAAFALLPDFSVELLADGTLVTTDHNMRGAKGEPKDAETMARIALTYLGQDGVGREVADQIRELLPRPASTGSFPIFNDVGNQIG